MQQQQHPAADATADAQLATGRDVADNTTNWCRDLIDSFLSGTFSLADFGSQLDPNEKIELLHYMATYPSVPFEVFQCVIDSTPSPVCSAAMSALVACRNGNLELAKWIIEMNPPCVDFEVPTTRTGARAPLLFSILFVERIDDGDALDVLQLLLERHPEIVRNARTSKGRSILHWAAGVNTMRAADICNSIIDAFPQLVLEHDGRGYPPLHCACMSGNLEMVLRILEKCPDSINAMTRDGYSPLHIAALALRSAPQEALNNVIRYLLGVDPSVASVRDSTKGVHPLSYACLGTNASNLNIRLKAITAIYNAYPQALVNDKKDFFRRLIGRDDFEDGVKNFLRKQLRYAEQARDIQLSSLHFQNALHDCAPLGSIKLFVGANPSTLQRRNSGGLLPLHTACEYHDCPDVTMYLLEFDSSSLFDQDNEEGNTPLHCACRAGNYKLIAMIFAQHQNLPVKERNSDDDLPMHLLADNRDQDDDSTGYLSCLFLFLKADPDLLLSVDEI